MGYFNSRPSARGDMEASVELFASRMNFNSRPSARGDPAAPVCPRPSRPHFNSRPSARGDIIKEDKPVNIFLISIHAPPRGATAAACGNRYLSNTFQFTPLREGRRDRWKLTVQELYISIHAPPRGATVARACHHVRRAISIHAPPRGATVCRISLGN